MNEDVAGLKRALGYLVIYYIRFVGTLIKNVFNHVLMNVQK